ncbi:caspase family protein [Planktothrix sp. FACHB-1355]|uniref:Caspase family protein n=1 Tax=Aerosakkonema funiforme FACHB-1375 TaxID=2949571 RepID=A0A926VN47_9CYAN|nr:MULTISPECIES: caspase family protein [Oscillatoriales]MBD2185892.1 caspase family protein [Aerosakkonema funiforme FACHB-1375]MBD3557671.1 caspase family protein [Planktothrix sp. FACHB-1355]
MTKVALLIGVSEYEPGLNPLPGAVKDLEAMRRVLQNPEMGGFAEANVNILKNPGNPSIMEQAIETLFSERDRDDLVLLYFSGHGIKDDSGKLYLATSKTSKNKRGELYRSSAVPASFIHDIMSNSRSKRQVVILDCCFSGAFAEGLSAKDDGKVDIKSQLGGEGRAILTSSSSTQYSFEQQGSDLSIYTHYLIEGIETGAADIDNDGLISVDELHEYARKKVQESSPAMKPELYAVKEGFKIKLTKAAIDDPKLIYLKEVGRYAIKGKISRIGRRTLDSLRESLKLLPEETEEMEAQVLKPYQELQQKLQKYKQAFREEIEQQYPLSEEIRLELQRFQEVLKLRHEDVASIEAQELQEIALKTKPEEAIPHPSYPPPPVLPKNRREIPTQPEELPNPTARTELANSPQIDSFLLQWLLVWVVANVVGLLVGISIWKILGGSFTQKFEDLTRFGAIMGISVSILQWLALDKLYYVRRQRMLAQWVLATVGGGALGGLLHSLAVNAVKVSLGLNFLGAMWGLGVGTIQYYVLRQHIDRTRLFWWVLASSVGAAVDVATFQFFGIPYALITGLVLVYLSPSRFSSK